jgi:hypothetical protein
MNCATCGHKKELHDDTGCGAAVNGSEDMPAGVQCDCTTKLQDWEDYEMTVEDALAALAEFYETGGMYDRGGAAHVIPIILREFERLRGLLKAGSAEVERMSLVANDAARKARGYREALRIICLTHHSPTQSEIARHALRGDYFGEFI